MYLLSVLIDLYNFCVTVLSVNMRCVKQVMMLIMMMMLMWLSKVLFITKAFGSEF